MADPPPEAPFDAVRLWRSLQQLVTRVTSALESDESAIDECLDIVVELLGADRGLVLLEREGGMTHAVSGRGAGGALTAGEREEVSRTFVQQALARDAVVSWVAAEQPVSSASVTSLGIAAALVAPLRVGGLVRGVLYVDFRGPHATIEPAHVEFFRAAIVLIGGMLGQASMTRAARERLAAAERYMTEAGPTPPLAELLDLHGMRAVRASVELALVGESPVLILGESGTGKTLFAQALADASRRRPVVRVVLGGSDDLNTITSELFGHERHAFSGAGTKRVGLVEYAHGGTLLLDEVLNLSPHGQKLLLDFTQFGTYRPLGYDRAEPKRSSVRIIAATNGDLKGAVRDGLFRQDLYYRLAGITITLPPLRERRHDIPALAETALARVDTARKWTLPMPLRRQLASSTYEWPGNVRELEWVVRRARDRAMLRGNGSGELRAEDIGEVAFERGGASESPRAEDVPADPAEAWRALQRSKETLEERESDVLRAALARHGGVVAHAAKELGIARTTLAGRLSALGLGRA